MDSLNCESLKKEDMAAKSGGDKYRPSLLQDEEEGIQWRYGAPPVYDVTNKLFEEGRTKEWLEGSLEEIVQKAIKTWEMEVSHKLHVQDCKTVNPDKFKLIINGREGLSAEETIIFGTYNALLKSSMPEELKYYKAEEESFESSHEAFRTAFPRGFAWEVIAVYSGPPAIAFKFRHWGFFEGPFKGHAPTGDMVQFYGMGLLKVDESLRAEEVEIYYDPAELFSDLLKGPTITQSEGHQHKSNSGLACPFHK
ncbi:pathogen-related protein-like [Diospyros lotus]|uniref:pathogen-related protein-like n=1 Tax=Diospyros lotus TaxID=55363 RepID=UPI00225455C8|nr:pathogen-related protein-like [Diospyros lotus]